MTGFVILTDEEDNVVVSLQQNTFHGAIKQNLMDLCYVFACYITWFFIPSTPQQKNENKVLRLCVIWYISTKKGFIMANLG